MDLSYRQATDKDWEVIRDLEKKAASVSPCYFIAYESEQEMKNTYKKTRYFLYSKIISQ